ncbi:hypothetical protein J2R76_002540 [Bradyrhizobium sp. USDA 4532]|uniref:hypothetical protein n=1 Tax=unclassified Bradyrhizobium TaxID=2631580 RepID=UPI00209F202B|nr:MULTISPECIES: hypothetical protein [unclassified Bradyrhizobium]MCP1834203.1 hypothetical protein [Bradyrhizobium sp. USDA 4545]MCP1918949.1 hypothetical protein [Bradyrhizobium sp. USDA 4532]
MGSGSHSLQVDTETGPVAEPADNDHLRPWLPLIFAVTTYLILITRGAYLLKDADIYWHIVIGQWIVDHRAVPQTDLFSFTMRGAPWITSGWLSEVLYFAAYKLAGWTGPVMLAALSVSIAFYLLALLLLERLPNIPVVILVAAGIGMASYHVFTRPHVLIFPVMVVWANVLVDASEQRRAPSFWYLPLITLWANLHGSFTLGLALIAVCGLEALWTADKSVRVRVALQWFRFAVLALGAACITPYGPESLLVTLRILHLGAALSKIGEWQPLNFGELNPVTPCLMAGLAYVLYSGLRLPPIRIAAVLAVIYQTLIHVRYVDVFALVSPFFVAGPLAQHLSWPPLQHSRIVAPKRYLTEAILALIIVSGPIIAKRDFAPPLVPRAAVEKLKEIKADRVFNDYYFGGYLIFQRIPTFIDSRAELYGRTFMKRYMRAISLEDLADFVKLLDEYKIDSTLLFQATPAVGLLDRLPGWERIYAGDVAVVHVRRMYPANQGSD